MITREELNYRMGWSLSQKVDHALGVIEQFYAHNDGKVYVSFSGGKDSSVLLYLIRKLYDRHVPAVFCNTGNEYPSIVKFVRTWDNITIIRPELTVREVIAKVGFPLISKEQAKYIYEVRHSHSKKLIDNRLNGNPDKSFRGIISKKWQFLIRAPFEVSDRCCYHLKKNRSQNLRILLV